MADPDPSLLSSSQQPLVSQHGLQQLSEAAGSGAKRKWGTVADGVEGANILSQDGEASLKRRNGAEVGGGGGGGGGSASSQVELGGGGDLLGAQTRKRKSLEKLVASSSDQDVVTTAPPHADGSSKKRKAGGGRETTGNGMDVGDASDEGTMAQGPALRLRFTRRGNAFAVTKRGSGEGFPVEGARNGEEEDGAADGEAQDGPVIGERYRSKARLETGLGSRHSGMEGEPSGTDGAFAEEKDQRQPPFLAADGATNVLPAKTPDPRQPLTWEIYRIPSHAGWFCWSKIHNIERRTLSEFFDGKSTSKTPKIYKDYRDYIINKYRENLQRPLTFTEVRRMLIGDVNALRRVFDFLDHWGLINHQVSQESNEQSNRGGPSPMQTVIEPIPSGVRVALGPVVVPTPVAGRPGQPDFVAGASTGFPGVALETPSSYKNAFIPALKDGVAVNGEASGKPTPSYLCSSCDGDCTKLRFTSRNELQAEFNLCAECFKNGKYRPGLVARDFTRIEAETKAIGDYWTTKETLSLLEAITRFGDNWNQVAEHVRTKSKKECVERFIQLPFGDRFLNDAGAYEPTSNGKEKAASISEGVTEGIAAKKDGALVGDASGSSVSPDQGAIDNDNSAQPHNSITEDPSPFADASNPILAQVAFMSAMVGPRVAAAAAQAAIMAIAEEEPAVANLPLLNGHTFQPAVKEGVIAGRQHADSLKQSNRPETRHQGVHSQQGLSHTAVQKEVDTVPAVAQMKAGIATALGAAAANAKLLADQEEREMERLMSDIIENQLKRLHAKVEHFEELEMLLEKERQQLEQARQLLYAQHIQFAESRFYVNRERNGQ